MNGITTITQQAAAYGARREVPPAERTAVGRMRRALQEHGPLNSRDLARLARMPQIRDVSGGLKNEVMLGRVRRAGELWHWVPEAERDLQARLAAAALLLRTNGYTVEPPKEPTP